MVLNGSLRDVAASGAIRDEGQFQRKGLYLVHHLLEHVPGVGARGVGVLQLTHQHLGRYVRKIRIERPDRRDNGCTQEFVFLLSRPGGFLRAACRNVVSTRYGDQVSAIVSGAKPHGARGIADHHPMGMSTGVFADLRGAWHDLVAEACRVSTYAVELSALSEEEFAGLADYLAAKPRLPFRYASVHAPVKNRQLDDAESALVLGQLPLWVRSIVAHPDALHELGPYRELGTRLVLENMDDRKATGRSADELEVVFDELPDAGFCLDVAHAHSIDPTMEAASELLDRFRARLRQVHVSSLRESHHVPLTEDDEERFAPILERCRDVPWILEAPPPQRWVRALKATTLIAV